MKIIKLTASDMVAMNTHSIPHQILGWTLMGFPVIVLQLRQIDQDAMQPVIVRMGHEDVIAYLNDEGEAYNFNKRRLPSLDIQEWAH